MKAIKRTVAAILATLMLATSTSFTLAAESIDAKEAEAIGKVSAAGIMVGDENGDFMANDTLTREQAAKIIVVMKGISESAVKAAAGTTMFNDVEASSWASGYINQASKLGIVKGVSATEFAPKREVTIQEFVTMAVRALGAGQLVDAEGSWPSNYVNFANENGLLDDVNSLPSNTAKRIEAAMIVKNALYAEMWEKSAVKTNGEITWEPAGKNILNSVLKLTETTITPNIIKAKDHTIDSTDVVEGFDLSTIKAGLTYHAYKNKDGELTGLWIEDDTIELTAIAEKYDSADNVITFTVDGKDKEYKLADLGEDSSHNPIEVKYTFNEKTDSAYLIKNINSEKKDWFGTFNVNEKNEITYASFYQYDSYFVVDEVTKSTVKSDDKAIVSEDFDAVTSVKYNEEDDEFALTKNGKSISYADLEEGDAVRLYKVTDFDGTNDKYVGEVIEPVTGKVTAKGTDYIKLDGKKYSTVANGAKNLNDKIKVNDEIDVYLNHEGKVVMYKVVEEDENYSVAMVTYKKAYSSKYDNEYGNYDIKLAFMDGTTSEVLTVDYASTYSEIKNEITNLTASSYKIGTTTYDLEDAAGDPYTITNTNALTADDKEAIGKAFADSELELGTAICYEINGTDLTVCLVDDEFDETSTISNIKVDKKYTYVTAGDTKVAYISDNTKVFEIEVDTNKTNTYKMKEVSIDDLEDTTFSTLTNTTLVGFDEDDLSVDCIIFTSQKFRRTTETNFAYIKEVAETKYDDKDAKEVTFIMLDGSEKSYIYAKDEADEDLAFGEGKLAARNIVDLEVNGELIMNAKVYAGSVANDTITTNSAVQYVKDVKNDILKLTTDGTDATDYVLADDVLVVRFVAKDTDPQGTYSKFKAVKEITDIEDFDDAATAVNDTIISVWSYRDEDGEDEVIAIFYVEADDLN